MEITKVVFRNFLQHENLDMNIKGNLIGILGSNGCGKSNFMRGLRYAFVGDVPDKRKEQLLRWGAQESGSVTVEFVHRGEAGVVSRGVNGGKTFFRYRDIDVKGITAVNDAVVEQLGLDKDIASTIFVEQAQLDKVLFESASVREQAFQKMCGLADTARIHKFLGELLAGELALKDDPEPYLAVLRQDLEQTKDNARRLSSATVNKRAEIARLPDRAVISGTLAEYVSRTNLLNSVDTLNLRVAGYESGIRDANTAITAAERYAAVPVASIDGKIDAMHTKLRDIDTYLGHSRDLELRKAAYAALPPCPVTEAEIDDLQTSINGQRAVVSGIEGNLKMYRDLKKVADTGKLPDDASCPLCGSRIADGTQLGKHVQEGISRLEANLAGVGSTLGAEHKLAEMRAARDSWLRAEHTAAQGIEFSKEAVAKLTGLKAEIESGVHNKLVQNLSKAQQARTRVQQAHTNMALAQHKLATATAELDKVNQQLLNCAATMALWDDDAKTLESIVAYTTALQAQQRQIDELNVELAGMVAAHQQADIHVASVTDQIGKLEAQRERMRAVVDARTSIDRVRTWLHYSNGPRLVAGGMLKDLTSHVNHLLEELNSPFMVSPDVENMTYHCHFSDGRAAPESGVIEAAELSGGQKVMLAVAFRLASYCMFAQHQGLLLLDEPSAYLDDNNIGNLGSLLERVLDIARRMGLQVFISTHEKELIPCFDALLKLD